MEKRYTISEFAKITNVSMQTLRNMDTKKTLQAYWTLSGQRYYTDEHIEKFFTKNTEKVQQTPKIKRDD